MYKVFEVNKNKKIEFTKSELEKLLNEVYNQGYDDGKNSHWYTWTSPYKDYWTYPVYTTTTGSSIMGTLSGSDVSSGTVTVKASSVDPNTITINNSDSKITWTSPKIEDATN